ncbi:MAG: AIR carboxylase family protein [Candidatus Diapherotrites archaeon]
MKKVLLLFGSRSDSRVYNAIITELEAKAVAFELKIASAHRTPKEVEKIVKNTDADVIIAGAGLSAALPGIVASHTLKPVIGVPVSGNYEGLDAFLSIAQMPPGIPVLAVGVDNAKEAAAYAIEILAENNFIAIIKNSDDPAIISAIEKTKKILDSFNVSHAVMKGKEARNEQTVYIEFVKLGEGKPQERNGKTTIYVPVAKESKKEDALTAMKLANSGLWVGLNRGENAALAAVEIINTQGKYSDTLREYRDELKIKVLDSDTEKR